MQLDDYIMRIPTLDGNTCKEIITEIEKYEWNTHTFVYHDKVIQDRSDKPCQMQVDTTKDNIIIDALYSPIEQYVKEKGKEYFKGWAGYTAIKYNKYTTGTSMTKHADHIHSIFENDIGTPTGIPILSIIGLLNDDYEGGEIEIFEDTKIKPKTGEVLIFPSIFLYPHRVCEVTKGTRYSFVSWVY